MTERLEGRVVRVTLRRRKDGQLSHDTRVEFDDETFVSVRIRGSLPAAGWSARLRDALSSRYTLIGELPEPRWVKER